MSWLPQHYEIRPEGVFIRQGFHKNLIPYHSFLEIESRMDSTRSGTWGDPGVNPILIVTRQPPRHFLIAPVD
jgi:hypothetical protein